MTQRNIFFTLFAGTILVVSLVVSACSYNTSAFQQSTDSGNACAVGLERCDGVCVSLKTDLNCGKCGEVCSSNAQCAINGKGKYECQCQAGMATCAKEACSIELAKDKRNCGKCFNVCEGSEICQNGECFCPTLGDGGTIINDENRKTAFLSDPKNCRQCGYDCRVNGNTACENGTCTCGDGKTSCPDVAEKCSVDLKTDPNHCGTCETACPSDAECEAGECKCSGDLVLCNNRCVVSNNDHCGVGCQKCPYNKNCNGTECQCSGNTSACPSGDNGEIACVPLSESPNCGGCGVTCSGGLVCLPSDTVKNGYACQCPAGTVKCGQECLNPKSENSCGATAGESDCAGKVCIGGASCIGGRKCECPEGQDVCDGQCVNKQVNVDHCGVCGRSCHGKPCVGGECSQCGSDEILCANTGNCVTKPEQGQECAMCGLTCQGDQACGQGSTTQAWGCVCDGHLCVTGSEGCKEGQCACEYEDCLSGDKPNIGDACDASGRCTCHGGDSCTGDKKFCRVGAGTENCVACNEDSQCGSGKGWACQEHKCVCQSNVDGIPYDVVDGECVALTTDDHCGVDNEDCQGTEKCLEASPGNYICAHCIDSNKGDYTSSDPSTIDINCNASLPYCVNDRCSVCDNGGTSDEFDDDLGCEINEICKISNGSLQCLCPVTGDNEPTDCVAPEKCRKNGGATFCAECLNDGDCSGNNMKCDNHKCVCKPESCSNGNICNNENICVCGTTEQACSDGEWCVGNKCFCGYTLEEAILCNENEVCVDGQCKCGNDECPPNEYCGEDNSCKCGNGDTCGDRGTCQPDPNDNNKFACQCGEAKACIGNATCEALGDYGESYCQCDNDYDCNDNETCEDISGYGNICVCGSGKKQKACRLGATCQWNGWGARYCFTSNGNNDTACYKNEWISGQHCTCGAGWSSSDSCWPGYDCVSGDCQPKTSNPSDEIL